MFEDKHARRRWSRFRLRAAYVLGSVSSHVRRELLEDLAAHVRDAMAEHSGKEGEAERLEAVLDRMGDPREFLAPLLADAVFRRPVPRGSPALLLQAVVLGAGRGVVFVMQLLAWLLLAACALIIGFAALARMAAPQTAGVFAIGPDAVEVRLLGLGAGGGEQLMPAWMAVLLVIAAAAVGAAAVRGVRHLLVGALTKLL